MVTGADADAGVDAGAGDSCALAADKFIELITSH